MKTSELIARLREIDPAGGRRVVVAGYETGVDDLDLVEPCRVRLHAHDPELEYLGEHRVSASGSRHAKPGIFIGSSRNAERVTE